MTSIGHGSTQTQSQSALTYLEYTATLLPNVLIVYIGGRNGSSSNVSFTNMTQVCTSEYQFLAPAVKEQPKEALIAANEAQDGILSYMEVQHMIVLAILLMCFLVLNTNSWVWSVPSVSETSALPLTQHSAELFKNNMILAFGN
ncbi:hypothetical protein F8M41_015111 [Gigaspora margarita]|uniref:Uncharacterized protein n=1 Tax=Gigaspora margarita TaxID=4874 RepID=A0A8H3ZXQ2_GIGMA|nr:hypothetical protein F8M41_015111 [Gigaspora margarita]